MKKQRLVLTFEQRHPWVVEDMLGARPAVRFTNRKCAQATVEWNQWRDGQLGIRAEWRTFMA